MTLTFEIDEKQLQDRVVDIVAKDIANDIRFDVKFHNKAYTTAVKEVMSQIIKEDIDTITSIAVKKATNIIAANAITKRLIPDDDCGMRNM